jgi:hypothetical protein
MLVKGVVVKLKRTAACQKAGAITSAPETSTYLGSDFTRDGCSTTMIRHDVS